MKTQRRQLVLLMLFVSALIPAFAQIAGDQAINSQTGGIDSALLAKANAGDAPSQVLVGESYAAGNGQARNSKQLADDLKQAAEWYRKAAEQGDVTAQGILGTLYSMGQGVPLSYPDAYYWLDLAAHVKGPNQEKYAANRQSIGTRITADELADVQDRVDKWLATHPR